MSQPEKRELQPILVNDPYSGKSIDVAPILYVAQEYFDGLEHVVTDIIELQEDFTNCLLNQRDGDPAFYAHHMYFLMMLRRAFSSVITGKFPKC